MLTIRRLYLYGVLGVSLVLLLWGLVDLIGTGLDALSRVGGSRVRSDASTPPTASTQATIETP